MMLGSQPVDDASCNLSDYYDSFVLYANAIVSPGAAIGPNTAALANPHGLPMEIHEIRFRVYPMSTVTGDFQKMTGLSLGVKLDLGSIAVSSEVPLNGFSSVRDVDENNAVVIPLASNQAIRTDVSIYSWRLKYPLLVPAGAVLTPLFSHLGQNAYPVVVDVAYMGHNLPPTYKAPAQVMVPWVSSYNSNSYDNVANAVAASEVSSELAILNQFDVPMEISRLTGTATLIASSVGNPEGIESIEDHRFRLGLMTIRGSRGDEVVRSPTSFNTLFPADWRVWDIPGGWIFRPGEFYKIGLRVAKVDYTPATDNSTGRVQYSVTAVGYRPMDARTVMTQALEASQDAGTP